MKSLKQSSLLCVCAPDSYPGRAGLAAETESAGRRDSPVNGGRVVFRESRGRVASRDHRESAERMVRWGSVALPVMRACKAPKATQALREVLARRVCKATPVRKAPRAKRVCRVRRERRACKVRRETPDHSGLMSLW